jgi:hypothetical protein
MDLDDLTKQAKDLVDKAGGTDKLEQDAGQLKDIATGDGSVQDKAKKAFDALKD